MANLIAVGGQSGCGKSTSLFPNEVLKIKGLNPEETVLINVAGKPLPVKGANKLYPKDKKITEGGNYVEIESASEVGKVISYISDNRKDIKNIVVDDAGYTMALEAIREAKNKGYDKWTDLAVNKMSMINAARKARHDINIICIYHTEKADDGNLKLKTVGKMIDNTVFLDGIFTVILYGEVVNDFAAKSMSYMFRTHSNGTSTCKSPVGMFENDLIPNDMGYVVDKVNEYYNG